MSDQKFQIPTHGSEFVRRALLDEQQRVRELLARDRAADQAERFRREAEQRLANGDDIAVANAVLPPTPEWLAQHETAVFIPKQPKGTTVVARSVRRVETPVVLRMHRKGKLTDDQLEACVWYRRQYEVGCLEGRPVSPLYGLQATLRSPGQPGTGAHMARTEDEAEARRWFRACRGSLPPYLLAFFDLIVLRDVPVSHCWHRSRAPKHKAEVRLRLVAERLVEFCRVRQVGLSEFHKPQQHG